jgi:hypothetical protein
MTHFLTRTSFWLALRLPRIADVRSSSCSSALLAVRVHSLSAVYLTSFNRPTLSESPWSSPHHLFNFHRLCAPAPVNPTAPTGALSTANPHLWLSSRPVTIRSRFLPPRPSSPYPTHDSPLVSTNIVSTYGNATVGSQNVRRSPAFPNQISNETNESRAAELHTVLISRC